MCRFLGQGLLVSIRARAFVGTRDRVTSLTCIEEAGAFSHQLRY